MKIYGWGCCVTDVKIRFAAAPSVFPCLWEEKGEAKAYSFWEYRLIWDNTATLWNDKKNICTIERAMCYQFGNKKNSKLRLKEGAICRSNRKIFRLCIRAVPSEGRDNLILLREHGPEIYHHAAVLETKKVKDL